jgi:hypothetical protein
MYFYLSPETATWRVHDSPAPNVLRYPRPPSCRAKAFERRRICSNLADSSAAFKVQHRNISLKLPDVQSFSLLHPDPFEVQRFGFSFRSYYLKLCSFLFGKWIALSFKVGPVFFVRVDWRPLAVVFGPGRHSFNSQVHTATFP